MKTPGSLKSVGLFVLILLSASSAVFAQTSESARVSMSASAGGVRRYTPGKWSAVAVHAVNRSETEATATMSVYFGNDTQLQFARRAWIPANTQRMTWLPIQAPVEIDRQRWSFDMTMLSLVESDNGEMIQRRAGQELLPNSPLLADKEVVKTAATFRKAAPDGRGYIADLDNDAYEMMARARELADFSRVIIDFSEDFAPSHPVMWESLDQFILCGDRILEDSAGLAVLRNWLFRGGNLCIFLDRTSPETVAAILGHADTYRVVDRVELDDFLIEDIWSGNPVRDRRRFETPVELVRVLADDVEVHCQINGWPAAFWRKAGKGKVLFIALAPDGWRPAEIRPGEESLPEYSDPAFRDMATLRSVSSRFFQPRPVAPNTAEVIQPLLQEKIGYRIPSRNVATGLLGLNGLGLVLGGLWLARRNQLDRMAALLPLFAGGTAVVFLTIGALNSRSVPPSVAFAQIIQFIPETDTAHVSGMAAIYQQRTVELQISAGPNGLLTPLSKPADGTTHRLVWTDDDSGRWTNVSVPAGSVQFASFDQRIQLPQPVAATGQFRSEGFVGSLPMAADSNLEDALIASFPAPTTAVEVRTDGSFVAKSSDVLPAGQFLSSRVVSDESRRRQELYRSLLAPQDEPVISTDPTFLAWMEPLPGTLAIPTDLNQHGMALATIPLWIERTPPATDFAIPATFIRIESVLGTKGRSLAYNDKRGRWVTNASRATNSRLRFILPKQVLPCQLSEAHLTIKLNAPSRALHLHAVIDNRDYLMERIPNPNGVFHVVVNRPEWLQMDEAGGIHFTIEITEAEQERIQREEAEKRNALVRRLGQESGQSKDDLPQLQRSFEHWEVDYVRLDARGKTL